MSLALCIGAQPSLFLPPRFNHRPPNGKRRGPTRVSMQFQKQIIFPSLKTVGTGAAVRNGFGFASKRSNKTSLSFACNALTLERTSTITQAPTLVIKKSPKLHDGGTGFPPRHNGGGGGGGGGGGESFSGGFFLFGFLLFMGYWKDLEREQDKGRGD